MPVISGLFAIVETGDVFPFLFGSAQECHNGAKELAKAYCFAYSCDLREETEEEGRTYYRCIDGDGMAAHSYLVRPAREDEQTQEAQEEESGEVEWCPQTDNLTSAVARMKAQGYCGFSMWSFGTKHMGCLLGRDGERLPSTNVWNWQETPEAVIVELLRFAAHTPEEKLHRASGAGG